MLFTVLCGLRGLLYRFVADSLSGAPANHSGVLISNAADFLEKESTWRLGECPADGMTAVHLLVERM